MNLSLYNNSEMLFRSRCYAQSAKPNFQICQLSGASIRFIHISVATSNEEDITTTRRIILYDFKIYEYVDKSIMN